MKKKLLLGLVVVMTVLGLAACGSKSAKTIKSGEGDVVNNQTEDQKSDTLEVLMASELVAINNELKQTQESQAEVYDEIYFKVEGNTCTYVYSCKEGVMLDASMLETLEESTYMPVSKSLFDALYAEYSIYPDEVVFSFVADGGMTEIYTYKYTLSDYNAQQ